MEQQNKQFYNFEDLAINSNLGTLIHLNFRGRLYGDKYGEEKIIRLKSYLIQCTEIQSLTLNLRNKIDHDYGIKILFEDLPAFKNLSTLQLLLSKSKAENLGAITIAQYLKECKNLTELQLNLNFNKINSNDMSQLVEAINTIDKIQNLQLWVG
ncbi:hypothetical protein ABPG72_011155, partial [Tetrahymena utriculariae]